MYRWIRPGSVGVIPLKTFASSNSFVVFVDSHHSLRLMPVKSSGSVSTQRTETLELQVSKGHGSHHRVIRFTSYKTTKPLTH